MKTVFHTQITVRITDLNYGGHLGNVSAYSYFHEARVRYFRELGMTEGDIGDGVALTQLNAYIEYKGEGFAGDVLRASVFIDEIKRTRFRVNYEFVRESDSKLIVRGHAMLAAFDYATRKPRRLAPAFIEKVRAYQSG